MSAQIVASTSYHVIIPEGSFNESNFMNPNDWNWLYATVEDRPELVTYTDFLWSCTLEGEDKNRLPSAFNNGNAYMDG